MQSSNQETDSGSDPNSNWLARLDESTAAFNQGPVVQKPINANLGLNLLNLGLNFNPRLLCVVQS
jgi:hypothetical protein